MCNELFDFMEGKPNEFKFVKRILADDFKKVSTNGEGSSFK